ncbi:MAG TPA: NYN domain-containing protein [Alphaproteobacteria bacterium]|nr:NYN domain-containing protein [Alphaproteobacteria bacterium]
MKIAAFIDGANLYASAKQLELDIDYRKVLEWLGARGNLVRAHYYTALLETEEYSPLRPLVDWLDYNGFTVIAKPAKEFTDATGRRKVKGNMDIEIAVDVLHAVNYADHIFLFTGDGDFRRLVEAAQHKGVRVTVISTVKTQPPMAADELRRQADEFIDLDAIRDKISKATQASDKPAAKTIKIRSAA